MPNLISLREQRAAKVDALRAIHAKAQAESRDLTDAENAAFDAGRTEVERLERDIRNAEFLAEAERRSEAEPVTGSRDMAALAMRVNAAKAIGEFAENGRLSGAEAEFAAEHRSGRPNAFALPTGLFLGGEVRAVTTTAPAGNVGGNLVPTMQGELIDRVRPLLATETLGATVLRDLTGNLDLPKLKASGSAYWVAEHGAVTGSDPQFAKVSMGPKTVGAEYEVSRRMLLQAASLETLLRADLGYLLRSALDGAAIQGGGSNEPDGILMQAGLTVLPIGANGGALTMDLTADMIGSIEDAAGGPRGFLTNAKVRTAAMKLKDGEGRPFGVPAVFQGEPAVFSNAVPSDLTKGTGEDLSALIYGVWSDLVIGYWSSVDILVNPYHSDVASKGGVLLHAFLDADIAVRHVESFVALKDVVTG